MEMETVGRRVCFRRFLFETGALVFEQWMEMNGLMTDINMRFSKCSQMLLLTALCATLDLSLPRIPG